MTIAAGITALADPKRLGSLGGRTIGLFAFTTAVAVSVGMTMATLIRPGAGAPLGTASAYEFPEPVTPCNRNGANSPPIEAFTAAMAASCSAE